MTEGLTDDKLDELERLREAGTQGPWQAFDTAVHVGRQNSAEDSGKPAWGGFDLRHMPRAEANAALIAASVNALPALVSEVRAMREERDRLRNAAREAINCAIDAAGGSPDAWKKQAEAFRRLRILSGVALPSDLAALEAPNE